MRTHWRALGTHLLSHLLWSSESDFEWSCRPEKERAPTWSWASVKSLLWFEEYVDVFDACIVFEVNCLPAGPSPTGVASGALSYVAGFCVQSYLIVSQ